MKTEDRNGYTSFVWQSDEIRMSTLLRRYPEIVIGRYIAIVSYDSGFFTPNEEEIQQGWRLINGIAYSPRVSSIEALPFDSFDEWFIFDEAKLISGCSALVNYISFSPIDFGWEEKREEFWSQIIKYSPRSVIGDGSFCYFVTNDAEMKTKLTEPNQAPEPTTLSVTLCAPSRTDRARQGRGSS